MKIAYLSEGHHVYDRRFLEKMVERGHQPYLISYHTGEVVQVDGVVTLHYSTFKFFPHFTWFRIRQMGRHLKRVLRKIRPDVLHTGYIQWHGVVGALCGFHPVLSMPWGSDILLLDNKSDFEKRYTLFTLKQADMITCDCQVVKNKIIGLIGCPPQKIVIFPWGIDLNIFRVSNGSSQIRRELGWEHNEILIMTRAFFPIYGIEYFIEALPTIIHQRPGVRVVLVGSGPLEGAYRRRLAELGLANFVHFAGQVGEAKMAEYLNAADVYVSTSLSDGTSASLLEAMACSLPVVVSDVPANLEWVDDGVNGYVVPCREVNRVAERVLRLLERPGLRLEMGERNHQIAQERADWERNFSILEGIYGRLYIGAEEEKVGRRFFPIRSLMGTAIASPRRGLAMGQETVRDWLNFRHQVGSYDDHLRLAMEWLARAQDATDDGGISAAYGPSGWRAIYPETTGYIISTLFDYARHSNDGMWRKRGIRAAEFLMAAQMDGGAICSGVLDGRPKVPSVFNTGQVIQGWVRAFEETSEKRYLSAAERAGDWLAAVQGEDGCWRKCEFLGTPHVYNTRLAWILLQLCQATGREIYRTVAVRNLDWALNEQRENGWFEQTSFAPGSLSLTHTIGYAVEGMLEAGVRLNEERYLAAALRTARALLGLQRQDGSLCGAYDSGWKPAVRWSCLVGDAQIALIWLRSFQLTGQHVYLEAADRAIDHLAAWQNRATTEPGIRGGIKASHPIYGGYEPFTYPSWGAKFFADLLMERKRCQNEQ